MRIISLALAVFVLAQGVAWAQAPFSVNGFRSAAFGMDEAEVRAAAEEDLDVDEDAIARVENRIERTSSLVVRAENLLPETGEALVVYIFGFASKQLRQVNVIWGEPVVEEADPAALVAIAEALQGYFDRQGFVEDSVVRNAPLENGGIMVFSGTDAEGRLIALTLNLPEEAEEEAEAEDETAPETVLRLSYIADPERPDIFSSTVQDGQF